MSKNKFPKLKNLDIEMPSPSYCGEENCKQDNDDEIIQKLKRHRRERKEVIEKAILENLSINDIIETVIRINTVAFNYFDKNPNKVENLNQEETEIYEDLKRKYKDKR